MPSPSRPAVVSWLSAGVLTLGVSYLIRMAGGLTAPDLPLSVSRGYLVATGAAWGLGAVGLAIGLFMGRRWAPRAASIGGGAFLLWYWIDRLIFVRSEYALRTLPFALTVTLAAGALLALALRLPAVRRYFGEPTP